MSLKVGVFDSGIGGQSMANAIQKALPQATLVIGSDTKHMPYGNKTPEELVGYVLPLLQDMADQGCHAIVIACNTVTTTIIDRLRPVIPVPLIGIEPMVKSAARQTRSGIIAVCATPVTLASGRYDWLKQTYASDIQVLQPDCSRWAYMIEHDQVNVDYIRHQVEEVCQAGADVIVLGCTHYLWIEELIQDMVAGRAQVIQPEQAVIAQLKRVLAAT